MGCGASLEAAHPRKGVVMARRLVVLVLITVGLFLIGMAPAQAWDLIADKSGNGRVTLRAWTRNYNQVAFAADHSGTRVDVEIVVNCRSGYHFEDSWSDGGRRFRFILRGLGNERRCDNIFRVAARQSFPDLSLVILARG